MSKLIDLTGQKFSRLTVLGQVIDPTGGTDAHWLCRCDCESIIRANGSSLRNGHTRSCGCYLKPWKISHHKNGVQDDNSPENLELKTKREHDKMKKGGAL